MDAEGTMTYPIARHKSSLLDRFHQTALLVCNIPHPVCLPGRDEQMRRPPVDVPIELILVVHVELGWILHRTRRTVVEAFLSVNSRVNLGEQHIGRRRLAEFIDTPALLGGAGWRRAE